MMHNKPHTTEAKAKMRESHLGKPNPSRHRETRVDGESTLYRCGRCGEFFMRDLFHSSRRTILGIKSDCKKCHNATNISSRNKENKRIKAIGYEAARRARKSGIKGAVTCADWNALVAILGDACLKCGTSDFPTRDHIIPLAKGGLHHPTNMQPLCRQCNEIKQARTADYRTPQQRAEIEKLWVIEFKRIPS